MKKIVLIGLAAVVAVGIAVPMATAAPAPKTTGDVGFNADTRSIAFKYNAIASSDKPITLSNIEGVTSFDFQVNGDPTNGHYIHNAALTQAGENVSGTGSYAVGEAWGNTWQVTAASVVGNKLDLTWVYQTGVPGVPGVTHHMTGTIANGSITGTWSDNYVEGGSPASAPTRSGTFSATGAVSTTYSGKGLAFYNDADNYYVMVVKSVSVAGNQAWFAGQVVDTNVADWMGLWGSFQVEDGVESENKQDKFWGAFADSEADARADVTGQLVPSTGSTFSAEYLITSGNLQVH